MVSRIFYVTQGSLRVWLTGASSNCLHSEFFDDDDGINAFAEYLAGDPDRSSAMLIDVIEEEFSLDSVPKLGARDRRALIERRGQRKFRRTPYRISMFQGKSARKAGEFSVVHSAISNHELLEPWLTEILAHQTPLSGVYSVPLMAPSIVPKLFPMTGTVLFVAQHQGDKLRQVFLDDGNVRSARLSQSPPIDSPDYAHFVVNETLRSRRYLERARLLGGMEMLDVCVVADDGIAAQILSLSESDSVNNYQFVDTTLAARKLGVASLTSESRFEEVFTRVVARKRPKHSYAQDGEDRYWVLQKVRSAILGSATAIAVACSIVAAVLLSDTWILRTKNHEIQSQAKFLAETFRRENEKFDPIKAGSEEMQLAVDTGDFLLANRVPVPWVMNQLGVVLGEYPDVVLQGLSWHSELAQSETGAPQQRRRENAPVAAPAIDAVSVTLTADLSPFDGDLRRAFTRIDQLTNELEIRTNFHRVEALAYPFDARTSAAVSGEIVSNKSSHTGRFQIRLTFDLTVATTQQGDAHESI